MKIILESDDLLKIIGHYYGTTLDPANVKVIAEPLTVEISKIDLAPPTPEPVSGSRTQTNAQHPPAPTRPAMSEPDVVMPQVEVYTPPKGGYEDLSEVPKDRIVDLDRASQSASVPTRTTTVAPGAHDQSEIVEVAQPTRVPRRS
jgi:hypothetical protein